MHNELDKYLHSVAHELRGLDAEQREAELREMRGHLEAIVAQLMDGGATEAEAVEAAIAQFGAARRVGKELQKAGTSREAWWRALLAPVCGMACGHALASLLRPALSHYLNGPAGFSNAYLAAVLVMGWLIALLSGAVAGSLSPRRGGPLLLCLKMAQIASLTLLSPAPLDLRWQQLLWMLASNCTSIPIGAHLGSRLARKNRSERASGPTEAA